MTSTDMLLLALAGCGAGMVNAVAGGGTLLTFPTLLAVLSGHSDAGKIANATSILAIFPGTLASTWGYRKDVADSGRLGLYLLFPSIAGGLLGSWLLVVLKDDFFQTLIPWLILLATILFVFQPAISRWARIGEPGEIASSGFVVGLMLFQFVVSIYGGYFGAGLGILMLSALGFMGVSTIHQMNGLKSALGAAINATSVVCFMGSGLISWTAAWPMIAGSIAGGYLGPVIAKRLDVSIVRWFVIVFGFYLSGYYFLQQTRPPSPVSVHSASQE